MKEIWRDIDGFESSYQVSNLGRVRRLRGYRRYKPLGILKPSANMGGYLTVWLSSPEHDKPQARMIHLLVAKAFIGPKPFPLAEVNHKDGIKPNNRHTNLEYVTRKQNAQHALKNGLFHPLRGESAGKAKLTFVDTVEIRRLRSTGKQIKDIATAYGVTRGTISNLLRGVSWK